MNIVDQNTSSWKTERKYGSVQEFFVERPELPPLALVALLRLPLWEKPWRARTGQLQEVLKAPHRGQRCGGFWSLLGHSRELGQAGAPVLQPLPKGLGGQEGRRHPWSSRVMVRPLCVGERWVLDCWSTGTTHHSWNWKIRICQCVIWINEDEMCCMNTSGAWSCRYPLGYSGSQGEKVDLCLQMILLALPVLIFVLVRKPGSVYFFCSKMEQISKDFSRLSSFK